MYQSPIILVAGGAGSGKDTVAEFIAKHVPHTTLIAQADPLKRFAMEMFGFTEDRLWGPSSSRNAVDPRFASPLEYDIVLGRMDSMRPGGLAWVREVLPQFSENQVCDAYCKLHNWATHTLRYGIDNGGLSARYVLQTLGTQWGREICQNVWTKYAATTAWKLLEGGVGYNRTQGLRPSESNTNLVIVTDGRFRNEILNFKKQGAYIMRIKSPEAQQLIAGVVGHTSETELETIPAHWFNVELSNSKADGLEALGSLAGHIVRESVDPQLVSTSSFSSPYHKE